MKRKDDFLRAIQRVGSGAFGGRRGSGKTPVNGARNAPEGGRFAFALALNLDARLVPEDLETGARQFVSRLEGKPGTG